MKPFALAAAAGAIVALAACSNSAATSAGPSRNATGTTSAAGRPAALVSCPRQYDAWRRGPAKKLVAALQTLDTAGATGDSAVPTTALKKAAPTIASAARYPIPACADPKGYWTALLMHVNAAAGSAASPSGRASVTLALKGVPKLEEELSAELKRITGA
ncbi:MAG TPA: hypothetical protein VLW50_25070 [Streptosporangiaceae bacterium]|nr:hypothetical protein [Streptosporangiaceae bacterium]